MWRRLTHLNGKIKVTFETAEIKFLLPFQSPSNCIHTPTELHSVGFQKAVVTAPSYCSFHICQASRASEAWPEDVYCSVRSMVAFLLSKAFIWLYWISGLGLSHAILPIGMAGSQVMKVHTETPAFHQRESHLPGGQGQWTHVCGALCHAIFKFFL